MGTGFPSQECQEGCVQFWEVAFMFFWLILEYFDIFP